MTIKWVRPLPGWFLFGMILLISVCAAISPPGQRKISPYDFETVSGPTYESIISDSLPHYLYTRKQDSLKNLKASQDYFNSATAGSEYIFDNIGLGVFEHQKKNDHFLILNGYRPDDLINFENKINGTEIHYPVWDIVKNKKRKGHYEMKMTQIKYKTDMGPGRGKIYLPISNEMNVVIKIILFIFCLITIVSVFYVILFIPFRFLFQLSKGKAFTEENIGYLYITGWVLIFFSLLNGILPSIAYLLVREQLPQEIHFSYYDMFFANWKMCIVGLGVILLAKAFLQGLHLKEDQDLTI